MVNLQLTQSLRYFFISTFELFLVYKLGKSFVMKHIFKFESESYLHIVLLLTTCMLDFNPLLNNYK